MRKALLAISVLFSVGVWSQTACFTYADDEQTIVSGTTEAAIYQIRDEGSLTIPSNVVRVTPYAFYQIKQYGNNAPLEQLIIEGNPEFEIDEDNGKNALADLNEYLAVIEIQGTSMTVENIGNMLAGCDNTGTLEKIDIYNNEFPLNADITSEAVNDNTMSNMRVVLPAARVSNQQFGNATIYGRFMLTSELVTFCGHALFYDKDDGSQFLFYVPTDVAIDETDNEKKIYIQRVKYICANQGVLLHNISGSSQKVELPRISEDDIEGTLYDDETTLLYPHNMLHGVTSPTTIGATETIGGEVYTNMILNSGKFYRTSGGTLGANRAYLQVKQSDIEGMSAMRMAIRKPSPTGIRNRPTPDPSLRGRENVVYDLQGRKVTDVKPGIYIVDGKKMGKR